MDGVRLEFVVQGCSGPVRVDVVHPLWLDLRLAKRSLHGQHGALTLRGGGHVEGVVAGAVADHLRVDARASTAGVLQLLEQERSGALRDDEAISLLVEGAGGLAGSSCWASARMAQ